MNALRPFLLGLCQFAPGLRDFHLCCEAAVQPFLRGFEVEQGGIQGRLQSRYFGVAIAHREIKPGHLTGDGLLLSDELGFGTALICQRLSDACSHRATTVERYIQLQAK